MENRTTRLSKDEYFLRIAEVVALRSTCLDKRVGCVLVNKKGIILSTGYNGAPHGYTHCTSLGYCPKDKSGNPSDCPSAHAEQNAIIHCPDAEEIYSAYLTLSPCVACTRILLNTGCQRVVFLDVHGHPEPAELFLKCRPKGEWIHGIRRLVPED